VRVPKSSAAAPGGQPAPAIFITVNKQFAVFGSKTCVPTGHPNNRISAFFAGTIAAFAVHTAAGHVQGVIAQVQKGIQRAIGDNPDVATATAIATRRPTPRDEFLAPKGGHAVAAMASLDPNFTRSIEHPKIKNARPAELTFGAGIALN